MDICVNVTEYKPSPSRILRFGGDTLCFPTHPVAVLIKDGYPKAWYPQLSLELRCTYNYEAMFDRCTLIPVVACRIE